MKSVSNADIDLIVERAQLSPRKRQHLNIHEHHDDPCQRLFNAIGVDSYIRPHRHCLDSRFETLFAIRGSFTLLRFGSDGRVLDVVTFSAANAAGAASVGVEIGPDDWHTVLAVEVGSVLLEVKAGPFEPSAAKEWAPWAPAEHAPEALPYFLNLRRAAGLTEATTILTCAGNREAHCSSREVLRIVLRNFKRNL